MDMDDLSLKATALLRKAGLSNVPKPILAGTLLLGIVLILVGLWHFWPHSSPDFVSMQTSGSQSSASTDQTEEPGEDASIVVDVEGAVNAPGLYELPVDSRIGDAVQAAGGLSEKAVVGSANLAQKVSDGEQVHIPSIDEQTQETASSRSASVQSANGKININTASAEELQALSGVGPALSERIVEYRQANGRFSSIDDLKNVSGIGDAKFASIKDMICI